MYIVSYISWNIYYVLYSMYCVLYIIHYMLYYILFILHYIYIYICCVLLYYICIYIYTQSVDMYQKDIDETPDFSEHVFCKAATVDLPRMFPPHMFPAGSQRVPRRNLSASCSNVGFVACGAWDVTRMLPGWRWLDGITMGLLWDYLDHHVYVGDA